MKTSEILIEVLKVTAIATVSYFAFKAGKAAYKKIGDFEDKVKAAGDAVADTFNSAKKSASDAIEKARKSAGEAVDATKKAVLHDGSPSPETRSGRNPEIDDGNDLRLFGTDTSIASCHEKELH